MKNVPTGRIIQLIISVFSTSNAKTWAAVPCPVKNPSGCIPIMFRISPLENELPKEQSKGHFDKTGVFLVHSAITDKRK